MKLLKVLKLREKSFSDKIRERDRVRKPDIDTRTYFKDIVVPAVFAPMTPNCQ